MDDVGCRRCVISDECGSTEERTKQKAGHKLEAQTEDL